MKHKLVSSQTISTLDIGCHPIFNIPETAFNYGPEVEKLLRYYLHPGIQTDISTIIEGMHKKPYLDCAEYLRDLGSLAHLTKNCLINPAGGFDIFTLYFLSNAQHMISISKEDFGGHSHFQQVFEKYLREYDIYTILTSSLTFDVWSNSAEDHTTCGIKALIRASVLLNVKIEGLYYFNLSDCGMPIFHTKDGSTNQDFKNAVLSMRSLNGKIRQFWYYSGDLLGSSQNLINFIKRMDFDLLIKASLNLFDKRIIPQACVRDALIFRAKKVGSQIVTDIDPQTNSLGSFWRKSPRNIILPENFEFGYSNYHNNRHAFCGSAHLVS